MYSFTSSRSSLFLSYFLSFDTYVHTYIYENLFVLNDLKCHQAQVSDRGSYIIIKGNKGIVTYMRKGIGIKERK